MKKFKIGDRVKWHAHDACGIVVGIVDNRNYKIKWDIRKDVLPCYYEFIVLSDYEDFKERIKDRLG